jgi:hypothetical protein
MAVYLVNALVPGRGIEITAQERDPLQQGIRLELQVRSAGTLGSRPVLIVFAVALLAWVGYGCSRHGGARATTAP